MRNIARIILFFSVSFVLVFLASVLMGSLHAWIEAARTVPVQKNSILPASLAARGALPLALYLSLLLTLSYSARRAIPVPLTIICLGLFAGAFALGASLGIARAGAVNAPVLQPPSGGLGKPGLILSRGSTTMILMGDPGDPAAPRVVSIPGRTLIYQEAPRTALPPAPFRNESVSFLRNMLTDISLTAQRFNRLLEGGIIPLGIYMGSLIFLLVSLRFVLDFSNWPLANLFLGALVFRGVLAFESFLNSVEIQNFITVFTSRLIPPSLISPGVYCGLGGLIVLYTALVSLARGRRNRDA
ncbi:MAG: hypothetical protein LBQ14_12190 [Treponema sp.]|nr:hypothetical protein [Treponema sp.]